MAIPIAAMLARGVMSGNVGGAAKAIGSQAAEGALTNLMQPLKAVTGAIGTFHQALFALEAPFKALEGLFQHVASYVGKLSPIRVEIFNRAVADFQAAVGSVLTPLMNSGTRIFRTFGAMVVTMEPKIRPLMQALGKFMEEVATATAKMAVEFVNIVPLLESITLAIKGLSVVLRAVTAMTRALDHIAPGLGGLLGRTRDDPLPRSAAGMSYVQPTTTTTEAMMAKLQEEAYGYSGASPADRTAESTFSLAEYFRSGDWLRDLESLIPGSSGPAARVAAHAEDGTMAADVPTLFTSPHTAPLTLLRWLLR